MHASDARPKASVSHAASMPSPARLQLLSLARRFIPEADGPLTVIIKANGVKVVLVENAEDAKQPATHLAPVQRSILRVLTDQPVSAKTLARLAGYKHSAHFRTALTAMARHNLLRRLPDGYVANDTSSSVK